MAKLWGLPSVQNLEDVKQLARFVTQSISSISQALTGNLTFQDNMRCYVIDIGPLAKSGLSWSTTQPTIVNHNLGSVPLGFIVANSDGTGIVYQDPDYPSTVGRIYLRTSFTTVTNTVIIIA